MLIRGKNKFEEVAYLRRRLFVRALIPVRCLFEGGTNLRGGGGGDVALI